MVGRAQLMQRGCNRGWLERCSALRPQLRFPLKWKRRKGKYPIRRRSKPSKSTLSASAVARGYSQSKLAQGSSFDTDSDTLRCEAMQSMSGTRLQGSTRHPCIDAHSSSSRRSMRNISSSNTAWLDGQTCHMSHRTAQVCRAEPARAAPKRDQTAGGASSKPLHNVVSLGEALFGESFRGTFYQEII